MKKENGKQEPKLCSSDEKGKWKNMETTEAKLCSSDEKRGTENMKTEAKTLFKW